MSKKTCVDLVDLPQNSMIPKGGQEQQKAHLPQKLSQVLLGTNRNCR